MTVKAGHNHGSGPLLVVTVLGLILAGCSTLQPLDAQPEFALPPADNAFWNAAGTHSPDDWHVLLNDGPTALDWRLRAIDSAA